MEIEAISGEIEKFKANCILLGYFEEGGELSPIPASIDKAIDGHISQLVKSGEIKGKSGFGKGFTAFGLFRKKTLWLDL